LQVGGRAVILFGLLAAEPKLQDKEPVMWLFLTWSTIEMIRSLLTLIIISYHTIPYHRPVFFNLVFEAERCAAILIARGSGTHGSSQKLVYGAP